MMRAPSAAEGAGRVSESGLSGIDVPEVGGAEVSYVTVPGDQDHLGRRPVDRPDSAKPSAALDLIRLKRRRGLKTLLFAEALRGVRPGTRSPNTGSKKCGLLQIRIARAAGGFCSMGAKFMAAACCGGSGAGSGG